MQVKLGEMHWVKTRIPILKLNKAKYAFSCGMTLHNARQHLVNAGRRNIPLDWFRASEGGREACACHSEDCHDYRPNQADKVKMKLQAQKYAT